MFTASASASLAARRSLPEEYCPDCRSYHKPPPYSADDQPLCYRVCLESWQHCRPFTKDKPRRQHRHFDSLETARDYANRWRSAPETIVSVTPIYPSRTEREHRFRLRQPSFADAKGWPLRIRKLTDQPRRFT
jgi:hypothetical protein